MTDIHLTAFSAESRDQATAQMISCLGLTQASLLRSENGKPFLQTPDGQNYGIAITHIRRSPQPFSLMAASLSPSLGLDAELWSQTPTDDVFLNSVMAVEETQLADTVKAMGQDAGQFLWVGKEAALKASGWAMVDPRHVALRRLSGNHFLAETSNSASAPTLPTSLRFYTLPASESEGVVLLAVAVANGPTPIKTISLNAAKLLGLKSLNLD